MVEFFVPSLKAEMPIRGRFKSRKEIRVAVFELIEGFYSRARNHSSRLYEPHDYESAMKEEATLVE